jgi:retinol dehydrogenase 12
MVPGAVDAAQALPEGAVREKVVLVTGASSGLGLETTKRLATQGAEIVMVARDQTRGKHARSQVARVATGKPPVLMLADLSVQAEVRRVADQVKDRYDRVDILMGRARSPSLTGQEA